MRLSHQGEQRAQTQAHFEVYAPMRLKIQIGEEIRQARKRIRSKEGRHSQEANETSKSTAFFIDSHSIPREHLPYLWVWACRRMHISIFKESLNILNYIMRIHLKYSNDID